MGQDLKSFVKNNRKFYKFADGETGTFIYRGFKVVPDRFNPDGETVVYSLQEVTGEKVYQWQNKSTKVAEQMANIAVGETIQIERKGADLKTSYIVTVI